MAGVHVDEAEPELAVPLDIELADIEEAEAEIGAGEVRVGRVRVVEPDRRLAPGPVAEAVGQLEAAVGLDPGQGEGVAAAVLRPVGSTIRPTSETRGPVRSRPE